jgi:type IV secretory pathway VirD2 relaxase
VILGTKLDWTAIPHWNTEHPHIHVIVRGKGDDGRDLVVSRDYISHGMRGRAEQLVTLEELGPRSDLETRHAAAALKAQIDADRWTKPTLQVLGERNDIIKRIHRGLTEQRIERNVSDFVLHEDDATQ